MRKLLIICYDFGLSNSPNSFRYEMLIRSLLDFDKELKIIVISNFHCNSLFEFNDRLTIVKVGFFNLRVDRSFNSSEELKSKNSTRFDLFLRCIKKSIFIIHDKTWKKIYWPDFAVLWNFLAFITVFKFVKFFHFRNLVVASRPLSNSLIPFFIKFFIRDLKWSLDYIDPFYISSPEVNNLKLFNNWNKKFEKKILTSAFSIFVLNQRIKNELMNVHFLDSKLFQYLPNFHFFEKTPPKSKSNQHSKLLKVTFVGSINPSFRNPKTVLEVFSKLFQMENRLELHFYGDFLFSDKIIFEYSELLGKKIFIHGRINKDELREIFVNSDFLLNIGNDNKLQEPSKLLEYIFYGKPIVNFSKFYSDASTDLLDKYGNYFNFVETGFSLRDEPSQNVILEDLIRFLQAKHHVDHGNRSKILEERNINKIRETFLKSI